MAAGDPPDNDTIAAAFAEVSDLLELTGDNPHRVRSYASVARTIEGLPRPASAMLADGTLLEVKGVGEGTAARVRELVETGRLALLDELRAKVPPGVVELLDCLDANSLPRAIATSSSHRTAQHHLAFHNLAGRFHHVVASGDYTAGKPAPDPYLMAAKRMGVAPGLCLALEDSYNGVRSASAAGMMTIMVPDLLDPTDEIRGLCTLIANDLHAVRGLLP